MNQSELPILKHGRLHRHRPYGRNDLKSFDNISSSGPVIGHSTIDKVYIDCRFLFKKSRWGVLGDHKNSAGIVYLDLTFHQPKGSQLHSAKVIVTLDDEDQALKEHAVRNLHRSSTDSEFPVQITDYYGPKGFTGPEKIVHVKKSLHLTPSVNVAGYGVGGMGFDKESSFAQGSRWKFQGLLRPGEGKYTCNTLQWDLSENDLDYEPMHSNVIHTAFTFEHGGQPFFMRVEIQGKLRNEKFKRLLKLGSRSKKNDNSAVTLINFGKSVSFKTPLDDQARQLHLEMEYENSKDTIMEMSDPKPVTYDSITQGPGESKTSKIMAQSGSTNQPQGFVTDTSPQQQQLPPSTQSQLLQDAIDPTLTTLAQAFVDLHSADRRVSSHDNSIMRSTKYAGSEPGTTRVDDEKSSEDEEQQEFREKQLLLQLLKLPAFLAFLRLVAGLMGFLGQKPLITVGKEAEKEQHTLVTKKAANDSHALPKRKLLSDKEDNRGFDSLNLGARRVSPESNLESVKVRNPTRTRTFTRD